jgi:hypothetical protein
MLLGGSTFGIVTFAICLLVIFFFDILPCWQLTNNMVSLYSVF